MNTHLELRIKIGVCECSGELQGITVDQWYIALVLSNPLVEPTCAHTNIRKKKRGGAGPRLPGARLAFASPG